jgi:tripartite-type tricarboxylate transporter receptor subunit TctC
MPMLRVLLGTMACMALCGVAQGQTYPVKPVRFVIGPAPDLLPRLMGQKLAELWGQQVVIDQRPAAGGIIAGETVAKSAPDGYTWLMSTGSFVVVDVLYPKLPYSFMRDFAPVTLMASLPFIAVVHPSLPVKTLDDLVQLAKAKPGTINYGSAGNGTTTQLTAEMFKTNAKIDMVHVPYKGVAPAVTDLLGGQVQLMFAIAQAAVPHVLSGKLRALAITSAKRSPAVPEVPTIAESGYPDIDVVGWNGIHVPAKTPQAIVARINTDVGKIIATRDFRERMIAAGFEPESMTVEQFDAYVRRDAVRYARVIREAKITGE